jgi:nucleotide-binding universal stress UspA family protein
MSDPLFERIVVGVDGSPQGFTALSQAQRLLATTGELTVVTVCEEHLAVHAGYEASRLAGEMHVEAERIVARSREAIRRTSSADIRLLHGHPADVLLRVAEALRAGLLVVGCHTSCRPIGIAFGSVATRLLHEAQAAVLIARDRGEAETFPERVVVGADGSPASVRAAAVAADLVDRFGSARQIVVARHGRELDPLGLARLGPLQWDDRPPVAALLAGAAGADLLVVGRRGVHGLAALGSVSERIAHRAPCSVLVVPTAGMTVPALTGATAARRTSSACSR